MRAIILVITVCVLVSCTSTTQKENSLVGLPFEVNGSAEAMPAFQKGHLLLHNFEYYDAAEAFLEAQKIDPDFVMAYWGEAMSYNHPVWGVVDVDKARAIMQRLGAIPEEREGKAKTELEKDFIRAIEILYGSGSKSERDLAYLEHMKEMYNRYPGNNEAATFYVLALLGTKEDWRNWENVNEQAAEISKAVLESNPAHPGALHYLIHSDDHPEYAKFALAAANDYSKVASYAGHALHMPSHIYLALGMWDEVVLSNEVAWQAGVDRVKNKALNNDELNYHSHLWLLYGYLQQGRNDRALELLKNQIQYVTELPSGRARFHLLKMKGHYLFETETWTGDIADLTIETKDLSLESRSVGYLIDGVKAFKQDEEAELMKVIQAIKMDLSVANSLKETSANITVCGVSSYSNTIPSEYELNNGAMMYNELQALLAWKQNRLKEAEELFRKAVEIDESFVTGPPDFVKLSNEFLGEFLLAMNRPEEANEQFDLALKSAPNRLLALKGKLDVAKQLNDAEKVKQLETQISERSVKNSEKVEQGV